VIKKAHVILLRLLHLIFGTIWVGGGFYYNFILLPKLRQMDSHTQRSVIRAVTQTMAPLLGISALITILSGGVMIALLRTEHGTNFLTTGWGISMMVGLSTSILAVVLVFTVEVPAGNKVYKLASSIEGRAPSSEESRELQRLSSQVVIIGRVGTALLFLALASMAVARFV
jgi:uncharacterized membrane protein